MGKVFQLIFCIIFVNILKEKVLAGRLVDQQHLLSDELEALLDEPYYDSADFNEYVPPGLILKKANFWAPHPSDYNPMRRPGTSTNQTPKRGSPYHPLPRTVVQQQKKIEDLENLLESLRDKRQSPGSYLLLKLGGAKPKPRPSTGRK